VKVRRKLEKNMTLEGQVLIIAFLALLLELVCLQIKPKDILSTACPDGNSMFQVDRETAMCKKITVAYYESPEAGRALASAIQFAGVLGAQIPALTIIEPLPGFMAYADAPDASARLLIKQDREQTYEQLHAKALQTARRQLVE